MDSLHAAVSAGADAVYLGSTSFSARAFAGNFDHEQMKEAIDVIDGRAETECSGNITKENIKTITALGVDYVSSGALTHSAPILDISLKHLTVIE